VSGDTDEYANHKGEQNFGGFHIGLLVWDLTVCVCASGMPVAGRTLLQQERGD
jgi:hypothetical protein